MKGLIVGLSLMAMTLSGCGGGGGGGGAPGGNPGTGNPGSNPGSTAPHLVSVSPKDTTANAFTPITMTFDKPMNPESFQNGLNFTPRTQFKNYFLSFACAPNDCKTITLTHVVSFEYEKPYTFTLLDGPAAVKDTDGNPLTSPSSWSFTVAPFSGDLFKSVALDGGGMVESRPAGDIPIDNAGECTTVAVDSAKVIHITYLSVSDAAVKHASCDPVQDDCSLLKNWHKEIVDAGPLSHVYGRDENMVIDQDRHLHVSYRDEGISEAPGDKVLTQADIDRLHSDSNNILKYATNAFGKDPITGYWKSVIVDDTTDGVTDTYIKVGNDKRIHISYHATNDIFADVSATETVKENSLYYATCSPNPTNQNCLQAGSWSKVEVEGGFRDGNNIFAQPNFIFVKDEAIHISYYANGALKYATCPLIAADSCKDKSEWNNNNVFVDGTAGDSGTENSLFVNDAGIHITYRTVVGNDGFEAFGRLRYAFCASDCLIQGNWKLITVDDFIGRGRSTQLKIDDQGHLHVVYGDSENQDLYYGFCPKDCLTQSNWRLFLIDAPGEVGHDNYIAIAPGPNGDQYVYLTYSARDHADNASKFALKFAFGPSPPVNP